MCPGLGVEPDGSEKAEFMRHDDSNHDSDEETN